MIPNTRRRTLRHIGAVAVVVVALGAGPASGSPQAPPTLSVTSEVAGNRSPLPFAEGDWTLGDGVWAATVRSWSVPQGTTTVTSSWRSPSVRAVRNRVVFASDVAVTHQGVLGNYATEHWVRACRTRQSCTRWTGIGADDVPDSIDPATLPFFISTGHGIELRWTAATATVWIEWRYTQVQRDASWAETSIRMAAGDAAKSVR